MMDMGERQMVPRAGVLTDRDGSRVYYGAVTDLMTVPWWRHHVYWHCDHEHGSPVDALRCARLGLRRLGNRPAAASGAEGA